MFLAGCLGHIIMLTPVIIYRALKPRSGIQQIKEGTSSSSGLSGPQQNPYKLVILSALFQEFQRLSSLDCAKIISWLL